MSAGGAGRALPHTPCLGVLWLRAGGCPRSLGPVAAPLAQLGTSAPTGRPAVTGQPGAMLGCGAGSPLCASPVQPRGHQTPLRGLPRRSPGSSSSRAPGVAEVPSSWQLPAPALFQRRRASTWARGAAPTSTAAATTEGCCQKGTAAAGRAAGARWTLVFYLLCFSCTGPTRQRHTAPRTALLPACGAAGGCRAVPGATGHHPWGRGGPSPCHPAFVAAASPSHCCGPAAAVNLFSRRCCPSLCRFI